MPDKIRYKKPPIVERIIGVYHKIPQEEFERRLPSWATMIHPEYSVPVNQAEWQLEIEDKDGVPWVKSLTPKAKIIYLFWKKHHDNLQIRGMRLRPDRLVFHLNRENENPHDFDELYPEMQKWLPKWVEHFEVPRIEMTSRTCCHVRAASDGSPCCKYTWAICRFMAD